MTSILLTLMVIYYVIRLGSTDYEIVEDHEEEENKRNESDILKSHPGLTKMKFKAPNLTDEDYHSLHMPYSLKCDGCTIIAYQLNEVFEEFNKGHPSKKKILPTSDILMLADKACNHDFGEYGIKEIDGVKRLSGPATPYAQQKAGMMQGGGRWPGRIQSMCKAMLGELDEEEIYNVYRKEDLNTWLCHANEELRDSCLVKDPEIKKKKSQPREKNTGSETLDKEL